MITNVLIGVGGLLAGVILTWLISLFGGGRRAEAAASKKLAGKQEAFIAIASHYLLTPISVIQNAVSILSDKPALELSARKEQYDVILSGEKRLYIIAEQMLLASKLVNGQLGLSLKVAQLHEPVLEAIKTVDIIAHQKKIVLHPDIQQSPAIELQIDPKLIQTAVVALLDNSIKFSQEGGTIEVSVRREGSWGVIAVSDRGLGFNAEQKAHATEKFYRGTPPYSYDYQGMGLGLHVAYVIVAAHNGDLDIDSSGTNKGSTVTLRLPLKA